ncbi:Cytochrome P450 [Heracleum sosnowskyi]|uniref:Cytochrome P450 n=1 Tax=Heracleum sosnowskyi TaxID=360622 RepID=A0AAD8MMQ5_9APIA|nr:Cytochrome P450 [Heracleum sosnowskyi]
MEQTLLLYAFPAFVVPMFCMMDAFLVFVLSMFCMMIYGVYDFILRPKYLRAKLVKQGIDGPTPTLILGNYPDIQKIESKERASDATAYNSNESLSLECCSALLPELSQWTMEFGKNFTFALGKTQFLYVGDGDLVREMSLCKTLDLGKPSYMRKERGPLLGKGILTTSKEAWVHQRKTIAPTFFVDKVKNMLGTMLDSGDTLVKSWEKLVETEGGIADIKVDDYVKTFTSSVASIAMFGRYEAEEQVLFSKCRDLMEVSGSPTVVDGRPFYRYYPTKKHREQWKVEKEIYRIIQDIDKKCKSQGESILQTLVDASDKGELGSCTPRQFIIDNCKELCIVAMEVPGITAIWGLMLLAAHPEWQERARAEVLEICGGQSLDSEKLNKMKVMKLIIQEIIRLYSGVGFTAREALADVNIGKNIVVPKGVNIWIWPAALHRDRELWGPDALKFNPGRFANGIPGACKIPSSFTPFGIGPRTCPGMNLGIMELKVLYALLLPKFSFSISPNYRHVPRFDVLLEPKYGVQLLVRRV